MASLAKQSSETSRIDHVLSVLTRQWQAIPEVVATWETWDELDRLDFVVEWPLREIHLKQVRQWNEEGLLSSQQRLQLKKLDRLIHRHRPAVDRLLEE